MSGEKVVQELIKSGRWSRQAAELLVRAGYKCEYCGLEFLASAVNYKQWQEDHLVPKAQGGDDGFENMVASCRSCNVDFKARWNPEKHAEPDATRATLIEITRAHIRERKALVEQELETYRKIVQ
jgi:5-methylcytosine-specific restriction endonuclease McrA